MAAGNVFLSPVPMVEETFDFSSLKEGVSRRFVQLLQGGTLTQWMFVDKANYIKCVTIRGIIVGFNRTLLKKKLEILCHFHEFGMRFEVYCPLNEHYREFETKFAKFLPYLRISMLMLDFAEFRDQPSPIPQRFPILCGFRVSEFVHVDQFLRHVHPAVTYVQFIFHSRPEEGLTFCNYAMSKLPGMPKFLFKFIGPEPPVDVVELLSVPKPSTVVRFWIDNQNYRKIHRNGQWMDY